MLASATPPLVPSRFLPQPFHPNSHVPTHQRPPTHAHPLDLLRDQARRREARDDLAWVDIAFPFSHSLFPPARECHSSGTGIQPNQKTRAKERSTRGPTSTILVQLVHSRSFTGGNARRCWGQGSRGTCDGKSVCAANCARACASVKACVSCGADRLDGGDFEELVEGDGGHVGPAAAAPHQSRPSRTHWVTGSCVAGGDYRV